MGAPEPMTPPECDLRGLAFMPLDVVRLRDSDLSLLATGDEFKAAVLLWSAAWHQSPAASLPSDERVLLRLSGLDAKAWKKARAGALRGWTECSDGRLYHPVVAEKALEAWAGRLAYRRKREADRERLAGWRDKKQEQAGDTSRDETATKTGSETPAETRFETPKREKGERRDSEDKRTVGSEVEPSDASVVDLDLDRRAWAEGVRVLRSQGKVSEKQARAFFGKLLSDNGLIARQLLPALSMTEVNATPEPQAYLTKAARSVGRRQGPSSDAALLSNIQ